MKLKTLTLALVAFCLTLVVNAHPIGKYIRHRNIAQADHIYAYSGHGHDKYSRVYKPRGTDKNFYHCNGLDHHVNCKHGRCHESYNGHHRSRHECRDGCHDHAACKPHSGSSCGHHSDANPCRHDHWGVHPDDAHDCCGDDHDCDDSCDHGEEEEAEEVQGDSKKAKIKITEE